jgi:hypothetical protein
MVDRERMIAQLLQMAIELGWTPPGDVIDEIIAGGLLITTQAMDVCEISRRPPFTAGWGMLPRKDGPWVC